ncbi:restriction endonuclease [Methylomonas koyamae]|uniref:restriction endonuclease n=1 Tax=Methylomonas koyamae TaxID=702114 RepID=UPI002873034A|nr:restriction endonuclease [Methylomonas koyamae]WNB76240.1 restriction endonuclease [Methylomonas koyamae]
MKGPHFLNYVRPLVEVLRNIGGSGATADVIDQVISYMKIPDSVVEETISSGASRVRNQIQWARMYLVKADLMDSSQRGVWKLTEKGYETEITEESVYALFKKVQGSFVEEPKKQESVPVEEAEEEIVADEAHGEALLSILKNLSPAGFEKICKRLLSEVGIHDVQITGGSGDQGIDGTGVIKVNEVVGFTIIFQCKRYKDSVVPHHVRDFRGTMQGRADKGIIITTGRFTSEAKKEAVRDGVPPIELIDGERLVSLFEKYQLGLKPKIVYDLVPNFFDNFK